MAGPLPLVAIVGRPNVGKSTLFNRFSRRRKALVDDTPGVTRDRLVEEVEIEGRRILLVDTAGLDPAAGSEIDSAVQAQARAAVEEADALIFLVDGQVGLLPEDEAVARTLRRAKKPLALLVNKIDVPAHEIRVAEFHALGLEPIHAISAAHGRGVFEALEALIEQLPEPEAPPEPEPDAIRVALVGRPNVGKSSLLNQLVGEERVVVSDVPGTTRDAIDTRLEREEGVYVFVDTAGLRRAGRRARVAEQGASLMAVKAVERAEVAIVLIDAEEGITELDTKILSLVRQRGCGALIALNKWDLLKNEPERAEALEREVERRLRGQAHHPLVRISALTGRHVERLFPAVRRLSEAARREIPTSELNRWLEAAVRKHEPAMAQRATRRRPIKLLYATQTGTRPPRITVFCSAPEGLQPSYLRYLENALRERFDFEGVPVRITMRSRRTAE